MAKVIAVSIDGEVGYHAPPGNTPGDYSTFCGLEAVDLTLGHALAPDPPKRQKITCAACRALWETARSIRRSDFEW